MPCCAVHNEAELSIDAYVCKPPHSSATLTGQLHDESLQLRRAVVKRLVGPDDLLNVMEKDRTFLAQGLANCVLRNDESGSQLDVDTERLEFVRRPGGTR